MQASAGPFLQLESNSDEAPAPAPVASTSKSKIHCHPKCAVMLEIQILLNQDIREVFTSFLHYNIILGSSYQVPGVI